MFLIKIVNNIFPEAYRDDMSQIINVLKSINFLVIERPEHKGSIALCLKFWHLMVLVVEGC